MTKTADDFAFEAWVLGHVGANPKDWQMKHKETEAARYAKLGWEAARAYYKARLKAAEGDREKRS